MKESLQKDFLHTEYLRNRLEEILQEHVPDIIIHSKEAPRIPNTSYISFRYLHAAEVLTKCPYIALSSGSACVTGSRQPSHVLIAMQNSQEDALAAVRFSLSSYTTLSEIEQCAHQIIDVVNKVRKDSPTWQLHIEGII